MRGSTEASSNFAIWLLIGTVWLIGASAAVFGTKDNNLPFLLIIIIIIIIYSNSEKRKKKKKKENQQFDY